MNKFLFLISVFTLFIGKSYAYYFDNYHGYGSSTDYINALTGTYPQINVNHSDGSYSTIYQNLNGSGYMTNSNGTYSSWNSYPY